MYAHAHWGLQSGHATGGRNAGAARHAGPQGPRRGSGEDVASRPPCPLGPPRGHDPSRGARGLREVRAAGLGALEERLAELLRPVRQGPERPGEARRRPHPSPTLGAPGQIAFADLQNVAEEQGVPVNGQPASWGARRPAAWPAAGEPPAKRPPVGSGAGGGAAAGGAARDPGKAALVDKVKALQRSDPTAKDAWQTYCEDSYRGVKDPSRHEAASLEAFLSTYGVD
ncbi:unnamed protein product [Prorocentrum cordatum]|uniref:Uncharacterized protein n=1 Tax=Prorocentrum cordatum TaxID=2364126 RepID=A0ABN9REH7_9DINO|nr:unnamed protein product [Polarella glacialis]